MKSKIHRSRIRMGAMLALGLFAGNAEASSPLRVPIRPPTHIVVRPIEKARLPVQRVEVVDLEQFERASPRDCRFYDAFGHHIDIDDARALVEGPCKITCEVLGTVHTRRNVRIPFERKPRDRKSSHDRHDKRAMAMAAGFYGNLNSALLPTPKEVEKFGHPDAARKYTRHGKKRR